MAANEASCVKRYIRRDSVPLCLKIRFGIKYQNLFLSLMTRLIQFRLNLMLKMRYFSQTDIDKYESPDKVITTSLAGIPSISLWIQASLRGNRTPFVI